jgi:hypothetical protein
MDARVPVTHKEGDRYPLRPPSFVVRKVKGEWEAKGTNPSSGYLTCHKLVLFHSSTAVVQLTVNQLVVGSIPACGAKFAPVVKW